MSARAWPYPRWVAHRGAGKLAPENTMAAFRLGAQYGYRMFECDAKLSADEVVFLMHDATLDRTTNAQGVGGELMNLDGRISSDGLPGPIGKLDRLATLLFERGMRQNLNQLKRMVEAA